MRLPQGKAPRNCPRCPRLVALRKQWRQRQPAWFNAPVPSFGSIDARLLIVGLAPGLQGANRTGRPFTGDFAGELLYATLKQFQFSCGDYAARPDDGLELIDARITNAVRCVPPDNKPTGQEIATCRDYLTATIAEMPRLTAILALGRIAHDSALAALGQPPSAAPFKHAAAHALKIKLFDSYHCSRYNTSTGRLTPAMFRAVVSAIRDYLDASSHAVTSSAFLSGGNTG
jgi:uracil-DNA glycosylase